MRVKKRGNSEKSNSDVRRELELPLRLKYEATDGHMVQRRAPDAQYWQNRRACGRITILQNSTTWRLHTRSTRHHRRPRQSTQLQGGEMWSPLPIPSPPSVIAIKHYDVDL